MIRILQIIPTLDRSGSEKQATLLAAGLPRDRFQTHLCCLTRGGPYEELLHRTGVPVTVLHKKLKFDPVALWKLYRLIRRLKPDIVHTWLAAANSYGRVAARRAGAPVIIATERCVDLWKADYWLWIDKWLARYSDRVIVNSRGVAEFYCGRGISPEKLTVIYNGVEANKKAPVDRAAVCRQLGLPEDAYLIVFVGRLAPQKRVMDLIWAVDILKWVRPVYLLVIGDGPQRERLEQFARDCTVPDRVRFLGHRSDVRDLLPAMDVFWLASGYEGMPNSVMEAMAAGLPVVATNIPGTNELVVDGQTGFLVPVGDRAAFAQRTFQLIEDPALARRMGEVGRRRVTQHFSVQRMIDQHVQLYGELLAQRRLCGTDRSMGRDEQASPALAGDTTSSD